MEKKQVTNIFRDAPISKAVLKNAIPAMLDMLMVLIYNLADTFFIGQTDDALQVAAVSLATPVFLIFMALGTIFGIGGTSVISRAMGEGRQDYAKKVCSFCMWSCVAVGLIMSAFFLLFMVQPGYLGLCQGLSHDCQLLRSVRPDLQLLFQHYPSGRTVRQGHDGPTAGKPAECGAGSCYDPGFWLGDRRCGDRHGDR